MWMEKVVNDMIVVVLLGLEILGIEWSYCLHILPGRSFAGLGRGRNTGLPPILRFCSSNDQGLGVNCLSVKCVLRRFGLCSERTNWQKP